MIPTQVLYFCIIQPKFTWDSKGRMVMPECPPITGIFTLLTSRSFSEESRMKNLQITYIYYTVKLICVSNCCIWRILDYKWDIPTFNSATNVFDLTISKVVTPNILKHIFIRNYSTCKVDYYN